MRLVYPAGGWLPRGAEFSWQRSDQGRDFVTKWAGIIQAPGEGECVAVGSDNPFPNGFGPAYAIVRIDTGRFAGHEWYLGHCTSLVRAGEKFAFGHPLAKADQGNPRTIGIPVDGGWIELGNRQADGTLGPASSTGHWFDLALRHPLVLHVADPALRIGNQGPRVLRMTEQLRLCGYLKRPYWHFNTEVHGAVVKFRAHHHLTTTAGDKGEVGLRLAAVLAQSAAWCHKHHRHEVP